MSIAKRITSANPGNVAATYAALQITASSTFVTPDGRNEFTFDDGSTAQFDGHTSRWVEKQPEQQKATIVLVRRIVPNYWEGKTVDGPSDIKEWTPIPYTAAYSFGDLQRKLPNATVIDVTHHFAGMKD